MFNKSIVALILTLCSCIGISEASHKALVGFDLSLAGYRLGMSYDDVAKVGPFHYEQTVTKITGNTSTFYASVEHAYVDGVAMDLQLSFKSDKVHKIVARISPDSFNDVLLSFQQIVGPGEGRSKVYRNYDGKEIRQAIYLWDFPNAEMFLVAVSTNSEFATISLTGK